MRGGRAAWGLDRRCEELHFVFCCISCLFWIYDLLQPLTLGCLGIAMCHVTPLLCSEHKSLCLRSPSQGLFDSSSCWEMFNIEFFYFEKLFIYFRIYWFEDKPSWLTQLLYSSIWGHWWCLSIWIMDIDVTAGIHPLPCTLAYNSFCSIHAECRNSAVLTNAEQFILHWWLS